MFHLNERMTELKKEKIQTSSSFIDYAVVGFIFYVLIKLK